MRAVVSEAAQTAGNSRETSEQERQLFALIGKLVQELHAKAGSPAPVAATSRLDRDLGIDSLGRTELILRIERAFQVRFAAERVAGG
jgi:acyl carrier protein